MPLHFINRANRRGIVAADLVLAAGGERTIKSLRAGGVSGAKIIECLDCGTPDALFAGREAGAREQNSRFIHFGRLVFHKGTRLAIESIGKAGPKVTLDIVGRGPELDRCKELVESLGLTDRVLFIDWYERREDLFASFGNYCGMILPSIEDANGIAVQESMAVGLVPICLDWGGPQLLIEHGVSGFLIDPDVLNEIPNRIARRLDELAESPTLAARMSAAAIKRAQSWKWSSLSAQWIEIYRSIAGDLNPN